MTCKINDYIDISNSDELNAIIIQLILTVLLIFFVIYQMIKKQIIKHIQGDQKQIVRSIIFSSIFASTLYFLNLLFQIVIYKTVGVTSADAFVNKYLWILQIFSISVWIVAVLINNFYLFISCLWYILINKLFNSNLKSNRPFIIFIIIVNIIQIVLQVLQHVFFHQNFNSLIILPFTIIPAITLIYMSIKFITKIQLITSIKNKKAFILRVCLLIFSAIIRFIYNLVFYLRQDQINKSNQSNCVRINRYYGILILIVSILIIWMPILVANTMFHRQINSKTQLKSKLDSSIMDQQDQIK